MMDNKTDKRAIALKYDGTGAPTVSDKRYREMAEQLVEDFHQNGGLVHEDTVLADWLDRLAIGEEIPEALYYVIAELIAMAWFMEGKTPPGWEGFGINKKV